MLLLRRAIRGSHAGPGQAPSRRLVSLLVLAVQAAALLAGCTGHSPPPVAAPSAGPDHALEQLLETRLGPHRDAALRALLGGKSPLDAGSAQPSDLGGLLGRVIPAGIPQLPIPTPPRDGALAAAVASYGAEMGVPVPSPPALAATVRPLGLDGDGEYALAQLVLAYTQAVHLQRQATSALTPQQRALAAGDAAAAQAWLAAGHSPDSLLPEEARLLGLIDFNATLQAADLLARTTELVRVPLARPPVPPVAVPSAPPDPWQILRGVLLRGAASPKLPPLPTGLHLSDALANLAKAHGLASLPIPAPNLPASLDHAVALIVQAKADGASHDGTWAALRMLQASQEAQPTLAAWAALLRMPGPPALDTRSGLAQAVGGAPDASAIVAALHGRQESSPRPIPSLRDLLLVHGLSLQDAASVQASLPGPAASALALMLDAHDGLQKARERAFSGLTPQQSSAVLLSLAILPLLDKPVWNATEAEVVQVWAQGMAGLDAPRQDALARAQEAALSEVGQAGQLLKGLQAPSSAPAPTSTPTPVPTPSTSPPTLSPVSDPVPGGPRIPPSPPDVCRDTPFSDCSRDILFRHTDPNGITILVTGFGSTHLTPDLGTPDILLDLGGDDTYQVPLGAGIGLLQPWKQVLSGTSPDPLLSPTNAENILNNSAPYLKYLQDTVAGGNALASLVSGGAGIALAIDAGGNDTYDSSASPAGEGVGVGPGALGVLMDLGGNDHYRHHGAGVVQGFGTFGGVGLLDDQGGDDVYDAPLSMGQGASDLSALVAASSGPDSLADLYAGYGRGAGSISSVTGNDTCEMGDLALGNFPPCLPILSAGIGLLVDSGPGDDRYEAQAGQGFSTGVESAGLLIDTAGRSDYRTGNPNSSYQGGRVAPPALAGDRLGLLGQSLTPQPVPAGGLGALIDLGGQNDTYGDAQIPLNDLVFAPPGTPPEQVGLRQRDRVWIDPDNRLGLGIDSSPDKLATLLGGGPGSSAVQLLLGTVDRVTSAPPPDPNHLDQAAQDTLFDDRLLCNAYQPGVCTASNRGDIYTCDPTKPLACLSLLTLTGTGSTVHDHPAIVSIDLGGSDNYTTSVAGTYNFTPAVSPQRGDANPKAVAGGINGITGFSLDLGGDDRYATPDLAGTQASDTIPNDNDDAAILLDLEGNDTYLAGANSQGSTHGGQAVALLADFQALHDVGDVYRAGANSQGSVSCSGPCASLGALVDLGGNDTYSFERQATARGGGTAVLLDISGHDHYTSSLAVNDTGLSVAHPNDAFASQGNATGAGVGVFVDAGPEHDLYEAPQASNGVMRNLSFLKDDALLRNNSPWIGALGGTARFADNPQAAFNDTDGDGAPGWLEILAGTNPNDPNDSPGSAQGDLASCKADPSLATCNPGSNGPLVNAPHPGQAIVGNPGIWLAQGLLIGGRSNDHYPGPMPPFFVDLGGDDTYTAPNVGSATSHQASGDVAVTLLLDVAGNDFYAPASVPCREQSDAELKGAGVGGLCPASGTMCGGTVALATAPTKPLAFGPCPVLGAAVEGIALLADGGGVNHFESDLRLNGTLAQDPTAASINLNGLSEGAGAVGGVGMLVTWNATNTFLSTVEMNFTRNAANPSAVSPRLIANGNTQGAAIGEAVGLLASFGDGNDTYSSSTTAQVRSPFRGAGAFIPVERGVASEHAQGAGFLDGDFVNATVSRYDPAAVGILFDGGGNNQFLALGGVAQGVSSTTAGPPLPGTGSSAGGTSSGGAVGLLWSGNGTDAYLAGKSSQGSATGAGAVALLLDEGGNDRYSLAPGPCTHSNAETASCTVGGVANAQGSGAGGLLLDLSGDDHYDARGWKNVQGEASGVLLDLGGDDDYRAFGDAQGDSKGLLLDTSGWDSYRVDPSQSGQGSNGGLFLDIGGTDTYVPNNHAGTPIPGFQSSNGNNQNWGGVSSVNPSTLPVCVPNPNNANDPCTLAIVNITSNPSRITSGGFSGEGIDAPSLQDALAVLGQSPDLSGTTVGLSALGHPPGIRLAGKVTLDAVVTGAAAKNLTVDRIAFLVNGTFVGDGTRRAPRDGEDANFTFDFDTSTATGGVPDYPDGTYPIQASAFLAQPGGHVHPDAYSVQSSQQQWGIDNPPTLDIVSLSPDAISPGRGQAANLALSLGHDFSSPESGANVTVTGRAGTESPVTLFPATILPAGLSKLNLTLPCGVACDGRYSLTVTAVDAENQPTQVGGLPLLADSSPPRSTVLTHGYVGLGPSYNPQKGTYSVDFASNDANGTLEVAGGGSVSLLQMNRTGNTYMLAREFAPQPAGAASTTVGGVKDGQAIYLMAVATDRLGNEESPCKASEPKLPTAKSCYLAKRDLSGSVVNLTFDFQRPEVTHPGLWPKYAHSGAPVAFNATILEAGSGLASAVLEFGNGVNHTLSAAPNHNYAFTDNALASDLARAGGQGPYTVTFHAKDKAGNAPLLPPQLVGYLDDVPPKVTVLSVAFRNGSADDPVTAGRPNMTAQVRVGLQDIPGVPFDSIAGLWANLPAGLAQPGGNTTVDCPLGDSGAWTCTFKIPLGAPDGSYTVGLNATDKAGNSNTTVSVPIQVNGEPLALSAPVVTATGPESFTVHWDSSRPASTQLRYGKTPALQHQPDPDTGLVTSHSVTLGGLDPDTRYYFEAVSSTASGITSHADGSTTTAHGFTLTLPGFAVDPPRAGVSNVTVSATDVVGLGAVDVRLRLQEVQAGSNSTPEEVDRALFLDTAHPVRGAVDTRTMALDTRGLPDGSYQIVLSGTRGQDVLDAPSDVFRIDNTPPILTPLAPHPGATVAESRPDLMLRAIDPLNSAPLDPSSVEVAVDGRPVSAANLTSTEGSAPPHLDLSLLPPAPLGDGRHLVSVALRDAAGNRGEVRWNFTVDTRAPVLTGTPQVQVEGGRPVARPGANVTVRLNLTDAQGVAAADLDLRPIGGGTVPLLAVGSAWEATFRVPGHAKDGVAALPVLGTDGLGNAGAAGTVPLPIDATPPTLHLSATQVGKTGFTLLASLGEPAALWVLEGDHTLATSPSAAEHRVAVAGLRPGRDHLLTVRAADAAGNEAGGNLTVRTLDDTSPPSAVGALSALSEEEGVVELSWSPAQDDSGVQAYTISRTDVPADALTTPFQATVAANATSFRDAGAPAGREAVYSVRAVDVADQMGPAATAEVAVLALPHLSNATVSPERGSTDDPFVVRVTYRHLAGHPADRVELLVGGTPYALHRASASDDCAVGCLYEAAVRLPATSLVAPARFTLQAGIDGRSTQLELGTPPVVRLGQSGGQGVRPGEHAVMPTAALQALLLVLLAGAVRRKR